jgi:uncharacterized coiled-coil protein SlyX
MAQIIRHRRGSLEALSAATSSFQKGELIIVSGSSNITSTNGSGMVFAAVESGSIQAVNRFIVGDNAPNTFSAGTYNGLLKGVPYYASGSSTLYLLGSGGNDIINLEGNITPFSASVATSFSASNASITALSSSVSSVTGEFSSSVATSFSASNASLTSLSASVASVTGDFSSSVAQTFATQSQRISSLESFSGSSLTRFSNLESTSASVNTSVAALNTLSASQIVSIDALNSFSGSTLGRLTNLESKSSSVDVSVAALNTSSASQQTSINSLNEFTASANERFTEIGTVSGSLIASASAAAIAISNLNTNSGSYATTGSNIFYGTQVFTGSLYVAYDLIVQGSSSLQYITASQVELGTNRIILNNDSPAVRFGGISVQDSGSAQGASGSLLWDSLHNNWIYQHPNVGDEASMTAILISGPKNSGSIGDETHITTGKIMVAHGDDHIGDSIATQASDNSKITISGSLGVSGSIVVNNAIVGTGSIFLQPDITDVRKLEIYNTAATDVHIKSTGGLTFLGDDTNYVKIDDSAQTITVRGVNGVSIETGLDVTGSISSSAGFSGSIAGIGNVTQYSTSVDSRFSSSLAEIASLSASVASVGGTFSSSVATDFSASTAERVALSSSIANDFSASTYNVSASQYSQDVRIDGLASFTGSYATTGSNVFNGNQTISGSLTTTGSIFVNGIKNKEYGSATETGGNSFIIDGYGSNVLIQGGNSGEYIRVGNIGGGGNGVKIQTESSGPGSGVTFISDDIQLKKYTIPGGIIPLTETSASTQITASNQTVVYNMEGNTFQGRFVQIATSQSLYDTITTVAELSASVASVTGDFSSSVSTSFSASLSNFNELSSSINNLSSSTYTLSSSLDNRILNVSSSVYDLSSSLDTRITNVSSSVYDLSGSTYNLSSSLDTRISNVSSSVYDLSGSTYNLSSSLDTRITNTSSSLYDLSGSTYSVSSSFDTRISNVSSSVYDLSGSTYNLSSSFDTRITNNSSSIYDLSGSTYTLSSSLDTRITNTSSSLDLLSGSTYTLSSSFDTRITNNSSSIAALSASVASTTGDFSSSVSGRLTNLESTTASLNTSVSNLNSTTESLNISVAALNSYSSSLKTAFEFTGSNVVVLGDLTVRGTTTTIDSTTVSIGDNIIELNGTNTANGGLLIKDPTFLNSTTGSLLWDSTNDYWIAGRYGSESKILVADGDSVVSGSSQITISSTTGFDTFSGSVETSFSASNANITSLSASVASVTGDFSSSVATSFSASNASITALSASVASVTGDFSSSVATSFSASVASQLSLSSSVATSFSASEASQLSLSSSFASSQATQNDRLGLLEISTGSLNSFTSSIDTTIKTKLNAETVVSGSIQVDITATTGYSTFSSSIETRIQTIDGGTY